jgi:glycosyltransferase involved in cell wall biosynthesis
MFFVSRPFVSVVIPCYNQAAYLTEAVQSVLSQTLEDLEVIIINDGSPDDTATVAKNLMADDDRIRLIEKGNGGLSEARNAGILAARGDLILPLDADDLIAPTFLTKAAAFFHRNGLETVVSCQFEFFGAASGVWKPKGAGIEYFVHFNTIVASSLFRKSLWQKIGGYDENMMLGMEDWDFWLRAADAGAVFEIIQEPLFKYRRRENSMIVDAFARRPEIVEYMLEKNSAIFQKHHKAAVLGREHEIADLQLALRKCHEDLRKCKEYRLGHAILAPGRWLKWKIYKRLFA